MHSSAYMLFGIPCLVEKSPPRMLLLLSVLCVFEVMLDTSTHLTGLCRLSLKNTRQLIYLVRFFTRKCSTILAVSELFTLPACCCCTTSSGENSRALLGGQDVAPLFLPPRALKVLTVGGDSLFNCTFEAGVPFALLTADSDP